MPDPDWTSKCGTASLYLGDCLAILPTLADGSVDAVITDPPYGINLNGHGQIFRMADAIAGDQSTQLIERLRVWAKKTSVPLCMFFSPYRPMHGFRSVLVWNKGAHVGIGGDRATCWKRDFELIGIEGNRPLNGKRDSAVLAVPALSPPPSGHVAEKPVPLLAYLIGKLSAGAETILDPFMGSGTTGVACARLGRRFIGIELEERYFDIAVKRIDKELAQTTFAFEVAHAV